MFRSSRLLSTARLCRSYQQPAVSGRFQQCRRQSGQPNDTGHGSGNAQYSRSAALGLLAVTSGAGLLGVLCLAKWSPKFRKWFETTVPGSNSLFNGVLKDRKETEKSSLKGSAGAAESASPASSAAPSDTGAGRAADGEQDASSSTGGGEEERLAMARQAREQDELEEALRMAVLEEERRVREAARLEAQHEEQRRRIEEDAQTLLEQSVLESEERAVEDARQRVQAQRDVAAQEQEAARSVSRCIDGALQAILSAVGDASKALYALATAMRQHSLAVYKVIELQAAHCDDAELEDAGADVHRALDAVRAAQASVDSASTVVDGAVAKFDALCKVAWRGEDGEGTSTLANVANQALRQLHDTAEEVAACRADQSVMLSFGERMQQQCEYYNKEMQRLADMQYSSDDTSSSDALSAAQSVFNSDIQALLSFAQQRVESMQDSLAAGQQQDAETMSALLLQQRQEDMHVAQLKLDHLREQLVREHQGDLQKQEIQFQVDMESDITRQLQRQAAAHADHLRAELERQAGKFGNTYRKLVDAALKNQTDDYQLAYHRLAGSMKGLESATQDTVASIEQGMRDIDLCQASSSLLQAVDHTAEDRRPLQAPVDRLHSAARGDETIEAALASIPADALARGVQSEQTLKSRFAGVRSACERVAFVGDKDDGDMLTYSVAQVFSFLYWPDRSGSSGSESGAPDAVDVGSLDAERVLQLASECLQDGKLGDAVRLLNQLRGQARVLAQDWLDEARLLLAAQQAAEIVGSCALLRLSPAGEALSPAAAAAEERQD